VGPLLYVLGDFALRDARQPVSLGSGGERLLAFLAVRGGAVHRAQVAGALWSLTTAERASSNLRGVLCRLPRPAGRPLVQATARHLRLADDVAVDLAAARASIGRLREGGPDDAGGAHLDADLLPGWDEDWLVVEREHHRQQRLHALDARSAVLCREGRYDEALTAALASVAGEPLRESAHRRVIEVHLAEGNHAEALRQYEVYRRMIRDELGISPTPGIRGLVAPLLGRPADGGGPDDDLPGLRGT
jgi:DNA-binding SARP family transcriptional activator